MTNSAKRIRYLRNLRASVKCTHLNRFARASFAAVGFVSAICATAEQFCQAEAFGVWAGTPAGFADVWQAKDFKSNENGSVAGKGVTGVFCGSVADEGLRAIVQRLIEF